MFITSRGSGAHDHSNPELNDWFKSLKSRGQVSCCDGSDYKGIADPDWRSQDGRYQVRLKGEWRDVPESAVIDTPNKVGQAMVWPVEYGDELFIRCFMPGALA